MMTADVLAGTSRCTGPTARLPPCCTHRAPSARAGAPFPVTTSDSGARRSRSSAATSPCARKPPDGTERTPRTPEDAALAQRLDTGCEQVAKRELGYPKFLAETLGAEWQGRHLKCVESRLTRSPGVARVRLASHEKLDVEAFGAQHPRRLYELGHTLGPEQPRDDEHDRRGAVACAKRI